MNLTDLIVIVGVVTNTLLVSYMVFKAIPQVHTLVNSRASKQDEKIAGLEKRLRDRDES